MGNGVLNIQKTKAMFFLQILLYCFIGCKINRMKTEEKTGVQLWGENCSRCHNSPPPTVYSDDKWETVSMHMKIRANISDHEITLIKDFLQSANED